MYPDLVELLRNRMPRSLFTVVCIVYNHLPATLKIVPDQFLAAIRYSLPERNSLWALLSFVPSASLMNHPTKVGRNGHT